MEQLSRGGAANAANRLAHASARLLVETCHRPARRHASVVVANLTKTPQLRKALLDSDPPAGGGGFRGGVASTDDPHAQQRRLVDSLVVLSLGSDDGSASRKSEEEIGMRRECMRALVGLAQDPVVRDMVRERKETKQLTNLVCNLSLVRGANRMSDCPCPFFIQVWSEEK